MAAVHAAGAPTVLDLLQAAIKGPAPGAWQGLQIVTSLPAAQEISSDAIAALLAEAIAHRVRSVAPLLQLPEARMLEAKFALEMLPKAVEAGLGGVAAELGRYEGVSSAGTRASAVHQTSVE